MKKALIQRAIHCLAHAAVYLLLYYVSYVMNERAMEQDPRGMYLFGWTVHNKYWYVWVVSLVLALFGSKIWAWSITLGNLAGVILGQFVGDLLYELGFFHTGFHPGFRIWIIFILASFAIGGVSEILSLLAKLIDYLFRKRTKGRYLGRREKVTHSAGEAVGSVAVEPEAEPEPVVDTDVDTATETENVPPEQSDE